MDSSSKIKFLLCFIRTMEPYSSSATLRELLRLSSFHKMDITVEEAVLPENDPLMNALGIKDAPKNRIRFADVVDIKQQPGYVYVYMRTGYMHTFSTNSSVRLYNHIYLDNMRPPGKLKIMWFKMLLFFRRKEFNRFIKDGGLAM